MSRDVKQLKSKGVAVGSFGVKEARSRLKGLLMAWLTEEQHISREEFGNGPWLLFLKTWILMGCLLPMTGLSLTMCSNFAFCSDRRPESPDSSPSMVYGASRTELKKRPVTVADSINMTRLGDVRYADGWPSTGMVAKFSPDRKHFVVILKKGNLEANTNEYSLVLFQTVEVFRSPEPQVLISLASWSNRPAISNVVWLDDSETIMFLGEPSGEQAQLYSLKCSSKELTKLTRHPTNLTSFDTTASGEVVLYTATNPVTSFLTENVSRKGLVVTNEELADLIRGSYGGTDYDASLFIKRLGKEVETKILTQGRIFGSYSVMSLSPDGAHLLLQTEAAQIPNTWSEYEDQFLKVTTRPAATNGGYTGVLQYELVDTTTGASQTLVDSPIPTAGSEIAWSPDGKSVVVSDVYLPLNVGDPAERALRKTHTFLAEFRVPSREFIRISDADLRLLDWDPKTGLIACDVGRIDSLKGKITPKVYFRKDGGTWAKAGAAEPRAKPILPDIVIDESMNTPPRIFARDASTDRKSLLIDLNPQFQSLDLARVEEVTWRDSHGNEVKGGLYWPPNYVAGEKHPLVLQTHGWKSDRFWMDGPFTTAFAAQALAGRGFFVLQVSDPDWHIWDTPAEAPRAMEAYKGAIDYLNGRGLIDRKRVGIMGFSRTYWYVAYTLTHSTNLFAAAALVDGADFSYFQYLAFSNLDGEFEQVYRGPPYGRQLPQWLEQSPSFLMDRIETPLRVQTLGPESVLSDWPWHSGLSRLGKPVEMIYIPEGAHILEKPWDRMISQQGDVDWFCFWLKGEEDPDPTKTEQYRRWHQLRGPRGRTPSGVGSRR